MVLCMAPFPGYALSGEKLLNTDTSNMGVGDVMLKIWKGQDHVIAYDSKTLPRPERNCCIADYCEDTGTLSKLPLWTRIPPVHNHSALIWLLLFKDLGGKAARWVQCLQEHNFTSKYSYGQKHPNTNALSKDPTQRHAITATKSDNSQRAWWYDLSLLLLLRPWHPEKKAAEWQYGVQFYRKWRLESIVSGMTSLTAVPSTRVTGFSGTP